MNINRQILPYFLVYNILIIAKTYHLPTNTHHQTSGFNCEKTMSLVISPPSTCSFTIHPSCQLLHTGDVCMTSRNVKFIQLSQLTKCPLNVSPFFNSTSYALPDHVRKQW